MMEITIRDGWPYLPPQLKVEGIKSWHANRDHLCLWQEGDNTKAWISLDGIFARIDQWCQQAGTGFAELSGAALDPHLYYSPLGGQRVEFDIAQVVGAAYQDGQHGLLHLVKADPIPRIVAGQPLPAQGRMIIKGKWFYRSGNIAPPANLFEFEAKLTDNQKQRYETHLKGLGQGLFVLIWSTPHGHVPLVVHVDETSGTRIGTAFWPIPASRQERLLRAGPDAVTLQNKKVVLFGVGAIGSHLASILVRSGVGNLTLVDADTLYRPGQIRHAAESVGRNKAELMESSLQRFDWTKIDVKTVNPWTPLELAAILGGTDLCVDATGLAPFTELLSRITERDEVHLVTVALYRGGSIARVRRQVEDDTPILNRMNHWRYPTIPVGNPAHDFVGVEVGCAALIHNAPPASVVYAASIASLVVIDLLTGRRVMPEEIIDVIDPIERPFERRGRLTIDPPAVLLTDNANKIMLSAATAAYPNETGGVLIGIYDGTGTPVITCAVELPSTRPSPSAYELPAGLTTKVVEHARELDLRVGYVGEWHSHPTDQSASSTDRATMRALARHTDTGAPILIVLRPKGDGIYDVEAHVELDGEFQTTQVVAVGPLPEQDEYQQ